MSEQSTSQTDELGAALAPGDEKLSPDEVPVMDYTGLAKTPQTEGKTLLIFNNEDGAVGVRVSEDDLEVMRRQL